MAGLVDMKILALHEPIESFMSPAKTLTLRNVKVKVKDLSKFDS